MQQINFLSNIVVHRKFISQEERNLLYQFAVDKWTNGYFNCDRFSYNQSEQYQVAVSKHLRHSLKFSSVDIFDSMPLFKTLYERITKVMELDRFNDYAIDPRLGWLMTYIQPGGFIQKHTDAYDREYAQLPQRIKGWRHIRFNVMVNRDNHESYDPHINNKNIQIDMCDAWCFPADRMLHYMPFLQGTLPRVVCQFGFAINTSDIKQ